MSNIFIYRFFILLAVLLPCSVYAELKLNHNIDWFKLMISLFGGLSLFLYGMDKMSTGMKQVAGKNMRRLLTVLTKNRVIALLVGAFVTMIIQSSSATTVMLVSFVQASLMTFAQTLAIILGASIGTTVTAQLVAFKLTDFALLIVTLGFLLRILAKNEKMRNSGTALFGFGLLFFGMKVMSDAMYPLRTYDLFIDTLKSLENPFYGILFGLVFTALIQSSSAFLGIVIVLAQQDMITLQAGVPLVIGTNIGTCVTAALASIGTARSAVRVAIAHILFKILGAIIVVWWIPEFAEMVKNSSEYLALGNARQIANAHTVYNVGLAFLFLPFTPFFERFINWIYPDKVEIEDELTKELIPTINFLDNSVLSNPDLAIGLARSEMLNMIKLMEKMVEFSIIPFVKGPDTNDKKYPQLSVIEGIQVRENKIDFLEEKVRKYLIKMGQQELSDEQTAELFGLLSIMNDVEAIADIIEKNMLPLIAKKGSLKFDFSEEGQEEIQTFHLKVCKQISRIKNAFSEHDVSIAEKSVKKMEAYIDLEGEYRLKHLQRLRQSREDTTETHEIHMEIMDLLKQINVYTGEMAKIIVEFESSEATD